MNQYFFSVENEKSPLILIRKIDVKCFPSPDALNPCEDVMGSQWLRTSVWIVVLLAVFGNVAVLLVLFSNWYGIVYICCYICKIELYENGMKTCNVNDENSR